MSSVFTKIIKGILPSYKVAETELCFAFLDNNPNSKGHALCVPKKEVDDIFDLDAVTYLELMKFSNRVAKAIRKSVVCKRVGMSVVGLEVPHVHVHLIPLQSMRDATFLHKTKVSETDLAELAKSIASNFAVDQSA